MKVTDVDEISAKWYKPWQYAVHYFKFQLRKMKTVYTNSLRHCWTSYLYASLSQSDYYFFDHQRKHSKGSVSKYKTFCTVGLRHASTHFMKINLKTDNPLEKVFRCE